jgi:hypothetical protein
MQMTSISLRHGLLALTMAATVGSTALAQNSVQAVVVDDTTRPGNPNAVEIDNREVSVPPPDGFIVPPAPMGDDSGDFGLISDPALAGRLVTYDPATGESVTHPYQDNPDWLDEAWLPGAEGAAPAPRAHGHRRPNQSAHAQGNTPPAPAAPGARRLRDGGQGPAGSPALAAPAAPPRGPPAPPAPTATPATRVTAAET